MRSSISTLMAKNSVRLSCRFSVRLVTLFAVVSPPAFAQDRTPVMPPVFVSPEPEKAVPPLPEEMRGLWVVRDSLATPESVHQVVETAVKYRFNALYVQVRGRGDAWYNSSYEPRADALRSRPNFDPLAQIISEAHARGLQVHAWLNTFLTWSGRKTPSSPQHLWNAHRDWFVQDRNGRVSAIPNDQCEGAFLQPSSPAVQKHLFNVFTQVAADYDVDGIHFDYCRYPNEGYDFSGGTLVRFREYMASKLDPAEVKTFDVRRKKDRLAYVHAFPQDWQEWRRGQVTNLVTAISAAVKQNKPFLQVSAAVFANAGDARKARGQDWMRWLQEGTLDAVALMAYDRDTKRILEQTRQAVAAAGEKHVYTGIGAWRLQAHDVAHKINELRQAGAAGINLFSYDGVHTRKEYLNTLARGVFASRAAPPRMRWLPSRNGRPNNSTPVTPTEGNK